MVKRHRKTAPGWHRKLWQAFRIISGSFRKEAKAEIQAGSLSR
jgi:hypothetical protein